MTIHTYQVIWDIDKVVEMVFFNETNFDKAHTVFSKELEQGTF